jgi:D-amino-acid oxidase
MRPRPDVLVLGAGVIGLTTAIALSDDGFRVRIITAAPSLTSTSCAAGAIWGPYLVEDERVLPWSEHTRLVLADLAGDPGRTGVRLVYGLEAARDDLPVPDWAKSLNRFSLADTVPAGFHRGWWYEAPIIEMPVYLRYLGDRLAGKGVPVELKLVTSLAAATEAVPVVVNCTGYGAYRLTGDDALSATRGQVVVVENPGIDEFFVEHDESPTPVYYLPHGDRLVLGGSAEPGRLDAAPDPEVSREIRQRCAVVEPRIADARFIAARVGLRPSRRRIRLEAEPVGRGHVVHHYGHGGAGVTTSWGCASEVVALCRALG